MDFLVHSIYNYLVWVCLVCVGVSVRLFIDFGQITNFNFFAKRMRSIVGLLLKHARAGLGYVKNFVKNTNQPEPKKNFTLKTRIKNLGTDPRAIWCGFLRGFVDTKKGNENGEKPARNAAPGETGTL